MRHYYRSIRKPPPLTCRTSQAQQALSIVRNRDIQVDPVVHADALELVDRVDHEHVPLRDPGLLCQVALPERLRTRRLGSMRPMGRNLQEPSSLRLP